MTSPPAPGDDPIVPANGYTAQTLYELQNVDPDELGAAANLDLQEVLEQVRNRILTDLLGGFASVPIAILDSIEDVIAAITGIIGGDYDDLNEWAAGVVAGFTDLLDALQGDYAGADPILGQIETWSTDLSSWVQDVDDFVQDLLDAVIRGITGIPVVGGAIADVISELAGLNSTATGAASDAATAISDAAAASGAASAASSAAGAASSAASAAQTAANNAADDLAELVDGIADDVGATIGDAATRINTIVSDLTGKVPVVDFQDLLNLGVQGATGASTPPTGQTVPNLRDALNNLMGRTTSAEEAATSAQGYLLQILAENNANTSGGISKSVNFVGANDSALDVADWTTYLGNTTPSATFLTKQNNNAGIRVGTTDGNYRPHAVLKTQYTTDNQSVAAVIQEPAPGYYSNATLLVLRSNAAMTIFTYAKFFGSTSPGTNVREISIGYGTRSGTTWTFNDQATITSPFIGSGALIEFRVDGNLYEARINSTLILQWNDGSSITSRGATFRYAGFALNYSRSFFVNYESPQLSQFSISDYAGAGYNGMAFRFYRTNTAAVTFGNLTGNGVKSPNGFYGIQQASPNIPIIAASEGLIKTPAAGWWTFEINYLMGAAVATSAVVYAGIWTGAADPPLSITAKTTGGAGSGGSIDQHIGGVLGPIYLPKDTYVAPCLWAIDTTSRSAKGGSLQNDCSFAGWLRTGG